MKLITTQNQTVFLCFTRRRRSGEKKLSNFHCSSQKSLGLTLLLRIFFVTIVVAKNYALTPKNNHPVS